MFEVGLIALVVLLPLRPDALGVAVLLAGGLLGAGLAEVRLADLARLALGASLPVTLPDLLRGDPLLAEPTLELKAARTVANASSSESWRVSTVTFMRCSWVGEWRFHIAMFDPRWTLQR